MTYVDAGKRRAHQPFVADRRRRARTPQRKRRNSQFWNMLTWGQLGRSPDVLAPFIVNLMQRARTRSAPCKHPHCDFAREHRQLLPTIAAITTCS